jgi:hypothetical protein
MLRRLIGEKEFGGRHEGQLARAVGMIDRYRAKLRTNIPEGAEQYGRIYRMEAWAGGLVDSLNELVQSCHMAQLFRKKIRTSSYVEDMREEELADYQCHVYFYKNAFVRVFSTLDKLGYFMNELFMLGTEKVKPRYSFFTVLRQMNQTPHLERLNRSLQKLKSEYKAPLNILRYKRNAEIHYINVEMMDDVKQTMTRFTTKHQIEDLDQNMRILDQGCEMVLHTMETLFDYCLKYSPENSVNA